MTEHRFNRLATIAYLIPGLPKLNPGLELANTFGVIGSCFLSFISHLVAA
jgi:hypothetical protein